MSVKCPVCNKTAYPLESIKVNGTMYHKRCFKCDVCKRTLNTDTVCPHSETGKIYCKTHYPQPKNLQAVDTIEMRRAKGLRFFSFLQPLFIILLYRNCLSIYSSPFNRGSEIGYVQQANPRKEFWDARQPPKR